MFQTVSYTPTDYTPMPWKNGGGQTTELLCGGPKEKYTWRLSKADIVADGPFSKFADMKRLITVIHGKGMRLHVDGHSSEVLAPFQTLNFDGSSDVQCGLLNGPVQDVNLIYSPAHVSPRWEWTEPGHPRDFTTSADTTLIYSPESETAVMSTGFSPIHLPPGHLLEIRNTAEPENLRLKLAGSRCLIIALTTLKSQNTPTHFQPNRGQTYAPKAHTASTSRTGSLRNPDKSENSIRKTSGPR
jgi:environmental stress-induced protein Ves